MWNAPVAAVFHVKHMLAAPVLHAERPSAAGSVSRETPGCCSGGFSLRRRTCSQNEPTTTGDELRARLLKTRPHPRKRVFKRRSRMRIAFRRTRPCPRPRPCARPCPCPCSCPAVTPPPHSASRVFHVKHPFAIREIAPYAAGASVGKASHTPKHVRGVIPPGRTVFRGRRSLRGRRRTLRAAARWTRCPRARLAPRSAHSPAPPARRCNAAPGSRRAAP